MSKPRISYVDPSTVTDPAMRTMDELQRSKAKAGYWAKSTPKQTQAAE